jgi:hypothetical protein
MNRTCCGSQTRAPDRASARRSGSWSPCVDRGPSELSMNRHIRPHKLLLQMQQSFVRPGSWSRGAILESWRLSMNRMNVQRSTFKVECSRLDVEGSAGLVTFMAPRRVQYWRSKLPMNRPGLPRGFGLRRQVRRDGALERTGVDESGVASDLPPQSKTLARGSWSRGAILESWSLPLNRSRTRPGSDCFLRVAIVLAWPIMRSCNWI